MIEAVDGKIPSLGVIKDVFGPLDLSWMAIVVISSFRA
jgi:rRNA processing protein Gar1